MAIPGHRSEASLGNYIGRPSSEQLRACSGYLFCCVEWKATSFSATEVHGTVISKKLKTLIHHVFIYSSIFFNWTLPSLLNRTKSQLKFPVRGEELALKRVVVVVVHAKQQIRIEMQTFCVADVLAIKWLNLK